MSYCRWFAEGPLERAYHEEWGTPLYDDRMQFEYLSLEVMQCGLSFGLVLRKRRILRSCFDDFDFDRVASYGEADVARIMATEGMIRSERKIRAVIRNAGAFRRVRAESGTFSDYLWGFTGHRTILYEGHETGRIPASNALSRKISDDLKRRGFSFLGPVVVYSHLQACGIINDHDADCPRRRYLIDRYPTQVRRRYGEKDVRQY